MHSVNQQGVPFVELPPSSDVHSARALAIFPREGRLWLAACAIMLLTGLLKGINLLILLSYLLIGVWILNWQLVRHNIRRVKGRRLSPGPIMAGEEVELQLEIASNGSGPVRGLALRDHGADHSQQWLILHLPTDSTICIRWRHAFAKRGRYRVEPLRASSQFPFGLTSRSLNLTAEAEWIILPRLGAVNGDRLKQWLLRLSHGDGRIRRRKMQTTTRDTDVHGLRDYRAGDSPRLIHWRSTARRGRLLVREFEDNNSPSGLVLVVEPWLPSSPTKEQIERLEWLISLAASICKTWCRDLSVRLTLVVAKPVVAIFPSSTGSEFTLRLLEGLAIEEGYAGALDQNWVEKLPQHSQSTPILVLSSKPSSELAADVAAFVGRQVAQANAGNELPWYEPPSPFPS